MSDMLKVTTPPSGYENTTKSNPISSNDTTIRNIIDTTKVTRPDGKDISGENQDNKFALNYESNYDKFIQMLKNTPSLVETFSEIMFLKMGTLVNSGISENFAQEISQFMEMVKMTEAELLNFMKNQSSSSLKFNGPFFDMLRQVMSESNSVDLKTSVLEFLKVYNNTVSSEHILKGIMSNLENIVKYMPSSYGKNLAELIGKLNPQSQNGDNAQNCLVLKEEIIPFLSKYVGRTHDLGTVRDIITMLTLNIAKYENGSAENYAIAFKTLLGYHTIKEKLDGIDLKQLSLILLKAKSDKMNTELIDKLISIVQKGVEGKAGYENKPVFESILNSFLINQSVYMPLLHMTLPVNMNGNIFFSEIWIDPDNDGASGGGEDEKAVKILIKFDIKDLGFFEMILLSKNNNVDMQLYYPEKLSSIEKNIKNGIKDIMERNNFVFHSFFLEKCVKPKSISEVFPKIYERKNAVNVKV